MLVLRQKHEICLQRNKMSIFGYDNPFYFIEHTIYPESKEFIRVIQSDHKSGTNPVWDTAKYTTHELCNNDENVILPQHLFLYFRILLFVISKFNR